MVMDADEIKAKYCPFGVIRVWMSDIIDGEFGKFRNLFVVNKSKNPIKTEDGEYIRANVPEGFILRDYEYIRLDKVVDDPLAVNFKFTSYKPKKRKHARLVNKSLVKRVLDKLEQLHVFSLSMVNLADEINEHLESFKEDRDDLRAVIEDTNIHFWE